MTVHGPLRTLLSVTRRPVIVCDKDRARGHAIPNWEIGGSPTLDDAHTPFSPSGARNCQNQARSMLALANSGFLHSAVAGVPPPVGMTRLVLSLSAPRSLFSSPQDRGHHARAARPCITATTHKGFSSGA